MTLAQLLEHPNTVRGEAVGGHAVVVYIAKADGTCDFCKRGYWGGRQIYGVHEPMDQQFCSEVDAVVCSKACAYAHIIVGQSYEG